MTLHKTQILPEVLTRITERRGKLHLYDAIDPARTALLVVDMQNCWVMEGQPGYTPYCPAVVPNINRLAASVRQTGATVVWIQMNASPAVTAKWQRFKDFYANEALFQQWSAALSPGNVGYELFAGLEVRPGDMRVEKNRFSAFIQGASGLQAQLEQRGIDTLLVTGTATNVCCESTARDAHMLNFKVIMVSDGNATRTDAEQNATLSNLVSMFSDVMTTDEVVSRLHSAAKPQKAVA